MHCLNHLLNHQNTPFDHPFIDTNTLSTLFIDINNTFDGRFYEEEVEEEKVNRMRGILGEGKAHYMPLIEQLLFMEDTLG